MLLGIRKYYLTVSTNPFTFMMEHREHREHIYIGNTLSMHLLFIYMSL